MKPRLKLVTQPTTANDGGPDDPPESARTPRPKLPALEPEQLELVQMGMPLLDRCAAAVARRYRDLVTMEELLTPGIIALYEAASDYDVEQHPSFLHYAKHHVHGRMLRAVHTEHFSLRARVEHAMERDYARISSHQILEGNLFSDPEEKLLAGSRRGAADLLASAFLAGLIEATEASPEDLVIAMEDEIKLLPLLAQAMTTLTDDERVVIELVYVRDMTLVAVAGATHVHLNTAGKRHTRALRKLRAILVEHGEPDG